MKTQLTFEQAFYGNDRSGYHILGNSDPAYSDAIERICGAIGTPDGFSEVSPFLISTTSGGMLVMICGRMGAPDSSNRKTLFFHALYASQTLCENAGINAFRLLRAGKFAESPEPNCGQVTMEFAQDDPKSASPPFTWDGEKLALICKAPANDRMEALLGDKAACVSWASFTFAPLADFRIYAISEYVSTPEDRVCRDTNGKALFQPNQQKNTPTMKNRPSENSGSIPQPTKHNHILAIFGILLGISVALNIILIVKPDLVSRPSASQASENTSIARPQPNTKISDPMQELRDKFAEENRIDWEKDIEDSKNITIKTKFNNELSQEKPFLIKLKYYVDFLNQNVLAKPNEAEK